MDQKLNIEHIYKQPKIMEPGSISGQMTIIRITPSERIIISPLPSRSYHMPLQGHCCEQLRGNPSFPAEMIFYQTMQQEERRAGPALGKLQEEFAMRS
jgi:hypothetical protein